MGFADAFMADERMYIKVNEMWTILEASAKIKAENDIMKKMLTLKFEGNQFGAFSKEEIALLFANEKEEN